MNGIIYIIVNRVNGKVYVGQTVRGLAVRMNAHKQDCRSGKNRPLYRSVKKYGWASFEVYEVAAVRSQKKLDNLERMWIVVLKSANREFGYNLTWGGEHGSRTEEAKQNLRKSHLGKIAWNKGMKMSKEFCLANSCAHKGVGPSAWIIEKSAALRRGKKLSSKTCEKMKQAALNRKPMKQSVRNKISKTLKEKGCMPPTNKRARGINNPFFGVKYFGRNAWKAHVAAGRSKNC